MSVVDIDLCVAVILLREKPKYPDSPDLFDLVTTNYLTYQTRPALERSQSVKRWATGQLRRTK